jgi:nucleoside-diphosphate-sugar epimerase
MAADADPASTFESVVQNNVIGTRNVYEAARQAGVSQVIFASTNHAVSGWEIECGPSLYTLDDPRTIDEHAEIRPDSPYGWSKAAGEGLGRHYVDLHGLRVHVLRIGWVLDAAGDADPLTQDVLGETQPVLGERDLQRRLRAIWLSHRDCVHLVDCCLRADHIRFGIYYGVSNNPRLFYDLANARRDLGYAPQDSAPRELGEA